MFNVLLIIYFVNIQYLYEITIVPDPPNPKKGLVDPDLLVRGMDPDADPSIIKQK
jgi:hypothetical protein